MSDTEFEILEPKSTEYGVEQSVPDDKKETIDESTQVFNRFLVESLNNQVKLVDSSDGLDLFCYIKCSINDSDTLKKCRGVVFNGDKLVMNGFPYTYEYSESDYDEVIKKLQDVFDKCSFYDSHEGSLIRMFYHGEKWYISTNRKLDANKSKWSSKESFGFYFKTSLEYEVSVNERLRDALPEGDDDILVRFQSLLDKSKQYMFLLLNNEQNRIVCESPVNPTFFHVGTFIDGVLNMDEDVYIPYPRKHEFSDFNDLFNYIQDVDIKNLQGVIVFAPNNTQYKIFNEEYNDLYKVRGNEPSIKFRYLQVRMNKRYNKLLHYLYPNFETIFQDYENIIYNIAKNIHKAYFDRFIKNLYIKVPPEEFNVIKKCHDWHIQDRSNNKINLNKVIEILNEQPPTNINKMIRRFYLEQKTGSGDAPKVQEPSEKKRYKPLMKREIKPSS